MQINEEAVIEMDSLNIEFEKLVNEKYWFDKERSETSLLNTFYYAEATGGTD